MLTIYVEKKSGIFKRRKLTVGFALVGGLVAGISTFDWSAGLTFGILSAILGWAYGTTELNRRENMRTLRGK